MDEGVAYGRCLTTLLLGLKTGAPQDALRADLVRVRRYARSEALTLGVSEGTVLVNGVPVDAQASGLKPLMEAMGLHRISEITILEGAVPKELLQLAVLLSHPIPGVNEATLVEKVRELSLWSVRFIPNPLPDILSAFTEQAREYNALSPDSIGDKAEEIATKVTEATAVKDARAVLAGLGMLHDAELNAPDMLRQAKWTAAFDKVATPAALNLLAELLPDAGNDASSVRLVLKRADDMGAAALITLLNSADNLTRRRVFFDAIVDLGKGIPLLLESLGAWQWYVVRNAALLLGEMKALEAEAILGRTLTHHDERVRIAVTSALSQLDTQSARMLVQTAIRDQSAEVRRRAVRVFATPGSGPVGATDLLNAISVEKDPEVQVEILYALGRVASVDAVQKLIRLCSQSGSIDKPVPFRIAAIEALTAARRSSALPLLRAMLTDPEPTIRGTARNLIESVNAMAAAAR
jgi:HEAT repeat protein